jgi:hypothetical protein
MKILNVDQYTSANRQISYAGKTYPVEEPNVQQFIDNLKAAEELEKSEEKNESLANSFEQAVKSIKQAIPSMPEETIRALKLPAITAILQFVRGELDPDVISPKKEETESGAEKK